MKLYHWNSEVIRGVDPGDIVVMAESVEEARELVRNHFMEAEAEASRRFKEWYEAQELDHPGYVSRTRANRLDMLEVDLAKEPKVIFTQVVFIPGSD
jgi:hypothetical protein